MKTPLVTAMLISSIFATSAQAQTLDGTKFRTIEEGSWYHPVEPDDWISIGANEQTLLATLGRIEASSGKRRNPEQPDTQIEYGPGNWLFEFSASGEEAMQRAKAAGDAEAALDAYLEALVYFHTGSAPHINEPQNIAAFERATDAFAAAAALLPGAFEAATIAHDGASFEAFLLLPPGDGPFPVLVTSNGSDQSSLTGLSFYREHLMPKGIAFLGVDVPGMGRSRAFNVADGNTDQIHVAAANWARSHPQLDAGKVFVQGISFGGNAAARLFLSKPELDLAGVIVTCGPMHQAFMAPPEMYEHFPKFTVDGVQARLGLAIDADMEVTADALRVLSLAKQGLFEGEPIATPLLVINTNDDPVAPLEDMDMLLARAQNAERVVFDMPGHCPPNSLREPIISTWIQENLR